MVAFIKGIITFVAGNAFWDYLVDNFGSHQKIILLSVVIVVILFVFSRFRRSQNSDSPQPPSQPPSPSQKLCPYCNRYYSNSLAKCDKLDCPSSKPLPPKKVTCIRAVSGILKGQEWILEKGKVLTVGRLPNCDIRFPKENKGLSREHCKIELRDDGVYIMDNSKYGTFSNGQRLKPDYWLKVTGNFYPVSEEYMFSIEVYNE